MSKETVSELDDDESEQTTVVLVIIIIKFINYVHELCGNNTIWTSAPYLPYFAGIPLYPWPVYQNLFPWMFRIH